MVNAIGPNRSGFTANELCGILHECLRGLLLTVIERNPPNGSGAQEAFKARLTLCKPRANTLYLREREPICSPFHRVRIRPYAVP